MVKAPSRAFEHIRRTCTHRCRRVAWNPTGMGTENRWLCPRRHQHLLLIRGEEKGSIESRGNISDVNNTLKPEELYWVEAILPTLIGGCGCGQNSRQAVRCEKELPLLLSKPELPSL